jgi:hypothetical protein
MMSFGLRVGLLAHSEEAHRAFAQLSVSPCPPQDNAPTLSWRAFCFALSAFLVDEDEAAQEVWRALSVRCEDLPAQLWSSYYLAHLAQFEGELIRFIEALTSLEVLLEAHLPHHTLSQAHAHPILSATSAQGGLGDLLLLRSLTSLKWAALPFAEPESVTEEECLRGALSERSLTTSEQMALVEVFEAYQLPLLALEALTYASSLWVREGGVPSDEEAERLIASLERLEPFKDRFCADLTLQLSVELSQLELLSEAEAWAKALTHREVPQRVLSMVNLAGIMLMKGALIEAQGWLERAASFDLSEHPPLVADLWSYNDHLLRSLQGQALSSEALSATWRPLLSAPFKVTWEGLAYRELEVLVQQERLKEAWSLLAELQEYEASAPRLVWFKHHQNAVMYGLLREASLSIHDQDELLISLEQQSYREALALSRRLEPALQLLSLADALTSHSFEQEEREELLDELKALLHSAQSMLSEGLFAGVASLWLARLTDDPQESAVYYQKVISIYEDSGALWDLVMLLMEASEGSSQCELRLHYAERALTICAQLFTWASRERRGELWVTLCELFKAWRNASEQASLAEAWRPLYTFKGSALPPLDPQEPPPAWVESALRSATLRLASEIGSGVIFNTPQISRDTPRDTSREKRLKSLTPPLRPVIPPPRPQLDELLSLQRPHSLLLDLEMSAHGVMCFWSRVDAPQAPERARQQRGMLLIELSSEALTNLSSWEVWCEGGGRARLERERDQLSWERLLIQPLLSALTAEGVTLSSEGDEPLELYLSPPHVLRHLPLHLSLCPHTGLSLFERFHLCWLPSLTSLRPSSSHHTQAEGARILVLKGCESRGELPTLQDELKHLTTLVTQGGHLLVDSFEKAPELIHWGAHGHIDPHGAPVITLEGEELTAEHLALLTLRASQAGVAPLIYLSACDLGAPALASPPMCDLSARCLEAGARAVICAQWPIPDVIASALSTLFYERYLSSDRTPRALYHSFYQALNALKAQHIDPLYWGGVRLWGR